MKFTNFGNKLRKTFKTPNCSGFSEESRLLFKSRHLASWRVCGGWTWFWKQWLPTNFGQPFFWNSSWSVEARCFFWVSSTESPLDEIDCHQKYRFMIYIPNLLGLIQYCDKIIKNNKNNKKITWPSPWDCLDSETYFKFVARYGMFIYSNVSNFWKNTSANHCTTSTGRPQCLVNGSHQSW